MDFFPGGLVDDVYEIWSFEKKLINLGDKIRELNFYFENVSVKLGKYGLKS